MMVHILNRAPADGPAAAQALTAMTPDDRLVLIEDAVLAIRDERWSGWQDAPGRIHVLEEDADARGVADDAAADLIDIDTFVALTAEARQTVSWY